MKKQDYLLVTLAIGISIGYYYCTDMLQTEQTQLRRHPYFLTSQEFNYLYFFTYLSQFLFLIPLGIVVDILPVKHIMICLIVVSIGAQAALAFLLKSRQEGYLIWMYIARGFLGISGLGILTIQGKLADQFCKKHYEYVMGLCFNIPYVFNALNSFLTSSIQSQTDDMPLCFFIGAGFCCISLIFGLLTIIFFLNDEQKLKRKQTIKQNEGFSLDTIKNFRVQVWVIVVSIFFTEGSINPLTDNVSDYITKSFGIPSQTVGNLVPILFICLIPFSIILGKFVEKFPAQKRNMMIIGRVLYMFSLIILRQIPQTDTPSSGYYFAIIVFFLIMSFNWAVFHSILEPCIAYFVEEKDIGSALGLVGSAMGFCQSVFSIMNIVVTSSSKSLLSSYSSLIFYYILIAGVALLLSIWIRLRDYSILDRQFSESHGQKVQESQNE